MYLHYKPYLISFESLMYSIIAFARSIDIHPGIVAGRLQHERIIPPNRCSRLKEKYVIELHHTS